MPAGAASFSTGKARPKPPPWPKLIKTGPCARRVTTPRRRPDSRCARRPCARRGDRRRSASTQDRAAGFPRTRPMWPHGQVTRIIMELHQKIAPADTGAEVPPGDRNPRCARGAKRGCARTKIKRTRSARMALGPHYRLHAVEDEKAPGTDRGRVCVDGRGSRSPCREVILARRWHGRDGERAAEAAPQFQLTVWSPPSEPTIGPRGPLYLADPSMSAAGRCGHFN